MASDGVPPHFRRDPAMNEELLHEAVRFAVVGVTGMHVRDLDALERRTEGDELTRRKLAEAFDIFREVIEYGEALLARIDDSREA